MKKIYLILVFLLSFALTGQTVKYTIAESSNAGYFTVNNVDYPKGHFGIKYDLDITDEAERNITVYNIHDPSEQIITSRTFGEIANVSSWDELYALFNDVGVLEVSAGTSDGGSLVNLATNDLGRDAWGRPKVINDYSLFSALFSYSVPNRMWLQYNDIGAGDVEQTQIDNVLVKSTHGHLEVTSNSTTDVYLRSKRHPRYQPNRGLLYSTALILPNPEYVGKRQFGLLNTSNGIYFELEGDGTNWTLSTVRRTTRNGVAETETQDITSLLPSGFDPAKGHVYDIQMQWRGLGDMYIYIDLKKTYTFELLGTLTELSISNPAMPIGWKCEGAAIGNDLKILVGCVDVTSEGGSKANKMYTSVSTGTSLLTVTNASQSVIAMRVPDNVTYDGGTVTYTRDLILTNLTTFCKDEAFISVYFARTIHTPNLAVLAGWTVNDDSLYEWRTNSDGALNTAYQLDKASMQLIFSTRNEKDISISHANPDQDHADFYIAGGDIIIVEIKPDGNSTSGATFEFAEEL